MVKLADSKPKSSGSFTRIFGDDRMGTLFSKVQSAMIRSGFDLEKILEDTVPENQQTTLESLSGNHQVLATDLPYKLYLNHPDPTRTTRKNPLKLTY